MTTQTQPRRPSAVLNALRAAGTFQEASALILGHCLAAAESALARSSFPARDTLQRASVHVRPDGVYRALAVLESGAADVAVPEALGDRLFSSTAWRWLTSQRQPIAIDVNLARVHLNVGDPSAVTDLTLAGSEFSAASSRVSFLGRDVTHVLVVPLLGAAGGAVEGMVTIEAQCRLAMGLPFIWPDCVEEIQLLADLAAPYLLGLPQRVVRPAETDVYLPVIGRSMATTIELLRVFAQQREPILIGGPTGAGKSRLARWCHAHSAVADHPFEALDLSALPEELQLAELFGWRRGAFSGAVRDKEGLIARAKGGTLFIDEITNLSPRSQAGLLHVLEERTYRVLGDGGPEKEADVRFIIGTNENLQEAVKAKRFREDLFYRVNVLPVSLPPLRERAEEIPLWAGYMLNRHHQKNGGSGAIGLSDGGQLALQREAWPGNLRQLDNILRRAYAIALIGHEPGGQAFTVTEEHIKRAMAYEAPSRSDDTVQSILAAAAAFVNHVATRSGHDPVELDLVDGFKGLVLAGSMEKMGGSLEEVFRLFGRERLVASRNHHKAFRRELERAAQLCAFVDKTSPFPFAALLDRPGGDEDPEDASPRKAG